MDAVRRFIKKYPIACGLAGLGLLALFLLFYKLGEVPLQDWDEAIHAEVSRNVYITEDWINLNNDGAPYFRKPPLRFWLGSIAYNIFDFSEFSSRIWSPIFTLGVLGLLYWVGRKLLKDTYVAFLAPLVALTSKIYLFDHASRSGEMDTILTFFMLLAVVLFWKGLEKGKYIIWAWFALALAFMTKPAISLAPLVAFLIYLAINKEWKKVKWQDMLKGLGVFAIVVIPWHWMMISRFPTFWSEYWGYHVMQRATSVVGEHSGGLLYYVKYIAKPGNFPWIGLAVYWGVKRFMTKKKQPLLDYLAIYAVVVFIVITAVKSKLFWYCLPMLPVLALLAAAGFKDVVKDLKNNYLFGFGILVVAYAAIGNDKVVTLFFALLALVVFTLMKMEKLNKKASVLLAGLMFIPVLYSDVSRIVYPKADAKYIDVKNIRSIVQRKGADRVIWPYDVAPTPSRIVYWGDLSIKRYGRGRINKLAQDTNCQMVIIDASDKAKFWRYGIVYEGKTLMVVQTPNYRAKPGDVLTSCDAKPLLPTEY